MSQPPSPFEFPSPFDFFGTFGTIFLVVFIVTAAFILFFWIFLFSKILKARRGVTGQIAHGDEPFVVQREVVREIVKVRCPYCGQLYEEKLDNCPYCGAKKR